MKNFLAILMLSTLLVSCSDVPSGNVGIKVYLLGGAKGVDHEVLGVGRYWIGFNEQLYLFPTFQQTYTWTKDTNEGSPTDESITFQTREGLEVNADIGISYRLDPNKISTVFQKYRKGVDEITGIYLRNYVRDTINLLASQDDVETIYGAGKQKLMNAVLESVRGKVATEGILIDNIYLIGSFRLPPAVLKALNSKIEATQRAQQRQNEVAEAEAQARKEVALAEGVAKANQIKQASITDNLIRWEAIQKWDGKLPTTTANAIPFINVK